MIKIQILGTLQDGGAPHMECSCNFCILNMKSFNTKRLVSSIAIHLENTLILIDATPDINLQIQRLNGKLPDSIFITHLHMGHYLGLAHLGKEASNTKNVKLYTSTINHQMLQKSIPFLFLYQNHNVIEQIIEDNMFVEIENITIQAFEVPHRNECGNTLGFTIINTTTLRKLCYLPDIDFINDEMKKRILSHDIILLDGTFWDKNDIQRQNNVPHPSIINSINQFNPQPHQEFYFIHINHNNKVLIDREVQEMVKHEKFRLAEDNAFIDL